MKLGLSFSKLRIRGFIHNLKLYQVTNSKLYLIMHNLLRIIQILRPTLTTSTTASIVLTYGHNVSQSVRQSVLGGVIILHLHIDLDKNLQAFRQ